MHLMGPSFWNGIRGFGTRDQSTPQAYFVYAQEKCGNPQLLHEVVWVQMILTSTTQDYVCSGNAELTSHSCEFCLKILP